MGGWLLSSVLEHMKRQGPNTLDWVSRLHPRRVLAEAGVSCSSSAYLTPPLSRTHGVGVGLHVLVRGHCPVIEPRASPPHLPGL